MQIFLMPHQPAEWAHTAARRLIAVAAQLVCTLGMGHVLVQPALAQTSTDDKTLPEVVVSAESEGDASLPTPYAGGKVATGGRVGMLGNKDFMETPFSTVNYTEEFVRDRQAQDISSIISATDPTVFTNGSSGGINESYSIRGFASSISDVSINGLNGISPQWRTTPEMFERVEVLKGPSALLNGMPPGGSVGGSVNLVTKRAGDKPVTRLTTTYMSDSQFGGHIDIGRRFGDNREVGVRFNGVYRDGDSAVKNQKKEANLASLGLDWRGQRARISADFFSTKDRVDGVNRGVSLASGIAVPKPPSADTMLNAPWTFTDTKDRGAIVRAEYDINDKLSVYATAGAGKTEFSSLASSLAQVFNDAGDTRNNVAHQRLNYHKKSAEVGVKGQFDTAGIGHEWAINASYLSRETDFGFLQNMLSEPWISNIYNPSWGPGVGTAFNSAGLPKNAALTMRSYGLADTLSFMDGRLQLTLGLRHQQVVSDTYNTTTGALTARYDASATTPAAAAVFRINERMSVYGNYVEGLSQGATAPTTAANPGEVFPPFKSRQKEVGLKFDLGHFAHTLSVYEIKRPSSYTDPVSNVFSFGGEQRNRGIEWGFFGAPINHLRLMGGIAYLQPKLTSTAGGVNQGKLATSMPQWQGKVGVELDVPQLPGLSVMANANATSKQYINATNTLSTPGRTIYDLGARYRTQVANYPVTVRANLSNVFNKAYWASTTGSGLGAPRTLQISASVDF